MLKLKVFPLYIFILLAFSLLHKTLTVSSKSVQQVEDNQTTYLPLLLLNLYEPISQSDWPMSAANPARTSWTSEEVKGRLFPLWYKPIEPYILPRTQIIAAYNTLYISTARGLYALDATTGSQKWIYPTELPLGNSPTLYDGIAYVGSYDKRIHAINAISGQREWVFQAGAGFDTNPLVVNGKVFAGNRDGYFYAIHTEGTNRGKLAWKYKTNGPIHYSAAFDNNIVYFASDDNHAYALDSYDGSLIWRSDELPGAGFRSWWPVVYQNWVIFSGSESYRSTGSPGPGSLLDLTKSDLFPNRLTDPRGTLVGPLGTAPGNWAAGTVTLDTSKPEWTANGSTNPITEYLEEKPWRRSYFVINKYTGAEYTSDFDNDGDQEFAPITWFGVRGGNRYPPIIGSDNILYQTNTYMSDPDIPGGQVTGWMFGTPHISIIASDWGAFDEPHAYSGGGNLLYWKVCCDRQVGTIDISIPNTGFADKYQAGILPPTGYSGDDREWFHVNYNLPNLIPDYNVMTYVWNPSYSDVYGGVYGGRNGSYGWHGDESPPIPYQGKLFSIQSNAIVAFSIQNVQPGKLPLARTVRISDASINPLNSDNIKLLLEEEVREIIHSGHMRPGWVSSGLFDNTGKRCIDMGTDYWSHPSDMIYTLLLALPYLEPELQAQTRSFLQEEFINIPPYQYFHIGWRDGVSREGHVLPPEVQIDLPNFPPQTWPSPQFDGWDFAPQSFYALWMYAREFGSAKEIFDNSKHRLESPPADSLLQEMPHVHNAFIAGYLGYLELEKMAGYPESQSIRSEYNRLLTLRATSFSKDAPEAYFQDRQKYYCRAINSSRNFMYLVPELGQYLHDNAYNKVLEAVNEYEDITPYWFVPSIEAAFGEAVKEPLFDYPAIFQAKAWILQQDQNELSKYIDIPATPRGDLFYIQNLVAALQANSE